MKKNHLFTLIIALAVAFAFSSCGDKTETPDASSLVGTTWMGSGTYSEPGYGNTTWTLTVSVLTASTGVYLMESGDDPDPGRFTYTYTPPTFTAVLTDEYGESVEGTISGNTLTVEADGITMTLTKQ